MTGIDITPPQMSFGEDFAPTEEIEEIWKPRISAVEDTLIYSNSIYDVKLGKAEVSDFRGRVYKVYNRLYDVIEMETTVLMRALFSADDYEAHVTAHTQSQVTEAGVTPS